MTRWSIAIGLSLLLVVHLWADQTRNDFARGFTAEPEGDEPFWELSLPDEVYCTVTRPDLGDLRVFDSNEAVVPHMVRRPTAVLGERHEPRALSFFPLRGRADEGPSERGLRVITDDQGAIISATREEVQAEQTERVIAYLIDTSGLPQMPNRLELKWERGGDGGFAVTVDVDSSDDLSRWRTVASRVTLADLQSGGATLVHREINLPPLAERYLRIEWPDSLGEVQLSGIQAFFAAQAQPLTRETIRVPGNPVDDGPSAYEFDTGGVRPVDQVRVVFQERNAVVDAVLLSRPTPEQGWRRRHSGTLYSLEREGTRVQSEPADLVQTSDRYWRLEIADGPGWAGSPPSLEIGWVPDLLTVVAQGDGPFTVAFGSATVDAADRTTDGMLSVINDERGQALIASARASGVFVLGGDSRLEPPPPPLPWRTWVLWAILVTGVVLLGWMVRQLVAGMGRS
jgi:hypothetical protein